MTLPKDQRAIIAGFRTMKKAEETSQQLEKLGVIDMRIDRVSLYPIEEQEERRHNPITGDYPGLASSLFDRNMDRDSSILLSSNPSSSGMADGNDENVGMDVILTVVVSSEKFDQAEKIVRQSGGFF